MDPPEQAHRHKEGEHDVRGAAGEAERRADLVEISWMALQPREEVQPGHRGDEQVGRVDAVSHAEERSRVCFR